MVTWYVSWCSLFLPFWGGPRTACTLKLCEAFCFTRSRSKSNSVTSTVTSQVLCGFYAYIEIDIDIDRCIIINIWLVVYLPLWKIWVRQLGWWHSQRWKNKIHVPNHQPDMIIVGLNGDGCMMLHDIRHFSMVFANSRWVSGHVSCVPWLCSPWAALRWPRAEIPLAPGCP